jgi:hypothetical protein
MENIGMPDGSVITPEMLAAAMQFIANQQAQTRPRPTGILPPNMIRGVNPNYRYEYREYPKALIPPDVLVSNRMEESVCRVRWQEPLPWPTNSPEGRELIEQYYARQEYPKRMTPPPVAAKDAAEEASYRAAWREDFGDVDIYPMWMFHATNQPVLVANRQQKDALGDGWFPNLMDAWNHVRGIRPEQTLDSETERTDLMLRADALGLAYDMRIQLGLLRQLVEKAEAKAA